VNSLPIHWYGTRWAGTNGFHGSDEVSASGALDGTRSAGDVHRGGGRSAGEDAAARAGAGAVASATQAPIASAHRAVPLAATVALIEVSRRNSPEPEGIDDFVTRCQQ
jgi:hypothetical protein